MSFATKLVQLDTWLQQQRPAIAAVLNPPAPESEIASIEETMDHRLPQKLRQLYLWHNGESPEQKNHLFTSASWPESQEYGPSEWAKNARWLPITEAWRERNSVMDAVNIGEDPMTSNWQPSCLPIARTNGAVVGVELRNGEVFLYEFQQFYTDPWGQHLASGCEAWLAPLLSKLG